MQSRSPRPVEDDGGFTLIEVIAAMVVLAILATAVAMTLTRSLEASRTSRQRVAAANVVSQQMDLVRDSDVNSLAPGVTALAAVTVDNTPYSLTQTVRWVSGPNVSTDSCAGTGTTLFKSVSIVATWPNMAGTNPVRSDTILTPDVGNVSDNSITVPIRVRDRNNAYEPGVAVQLTGSGTSLSQITDDYGCVVFANLPATTYTASVVSSTTPPSVNWQGSSTNQVTVGTSVGGTWLATTEFQWDKAASLVLTPAAPDASHPVPAGVGATVTNTNLATPGYKGFSGTGTSVTAANLFPFSNGYYSWAGTCADASPVSNGGGLASPAAIVGPGATANVTPATQAVNVTVQMKTGSNSNRTVVATHAPDSGCPSGLSLTLGTTTSTDPTVHAGLPYGYWTFSVQGATWQNPATSWGTTRVTPTTPVSVTVKAQ